MDFSDLFFIDAQGVHTSDYPTVQAWLISQYQAIYGADVYLEPDSQDGQWIAVVAKALYDCGNYGASVYNSFSPVTAQGVGLSRNVKINGLNRNVPSFSTVTLTIVGQAATVITNGVATDILQQQWLLPQTVTIPGGGSIDVVATAALIGAVDASANTVTTIFTPTRGWQTVNNAGAATPGAAVESDAALRVRQSKSVAIPSLTVVDGTTGSIANVPGVTKVQTYENDTETTDANGLPEHSICSVVAGGDDTAVAQAIQIHKTPGAVTYGDTTVLVRDSHGMPLNISFQRADSATIVAVVTIVTGAGWSTDYIPLIQSAIAATLNAIPIGSTIFFSSLFAPAYLPGTAAGLTYSITSILIGKNGNTPAAANIDLDFDENPVCDPLTDVTVTT